MSGVLMRSRVNVIVEGLFATIVLTTLSIVAQVMKAFLLPKNRKAYLDLIAKDLMV